MPMVKKDMAPAAAATPAPEAPKAAAPAAAPVDSGTAAAVSRLQKKTTPEKTAAPAPRPVGNGGRDYNEEAHGKTRCVQFQAALASPAIAGMKFDTMEEYLELCRQAANFGTAYTFGELPEKK